MIFILRSDSRISLRIFFYFFLFLVRDKKKGTHCIVQVPAREGSEGRRRAAGERDREKEKQRDRVIESRAEGRAGCARVGAAPRPGLDRLSGGYWRGRWGRVFISFLSRGATRRSVCAHPSGREEHTVSARLSGEGGWGR